MIWEYIRDFLVNYIFGGTDSQGSIVTVTLGDGLYSDSGIAEIGGYSVGLGDWLSTTTTIIIMCAIVFLFALLVRWIFKAVTSAFLLK